MGGMLEEWGTPGAIKGAILMDSQIGVRKFGLRSILLIGKHLKNSLPTPGPANIGLTLKEKGPSRVTGIVLACGQWCEQINDC